MNELNSGESRLLLHTETPIQSVDNRFLRRLEERREASHALVLDGPLLSSHFVLLGVLLQEAARWILGMVEVVVGRGLSKDAHHPGNKKYFGLARYSISYYF